MLQKLHCHSPITTTIGYQQNFIQKDADDALDSVLAFEPVQPIHKKKLDMVTL